MSLRFHKLCTGKPQLDAGIGMDRIVDAAVVRHEAAEHLAICGIDDRICSKPRDIALPDSKTLLCHRNALQRDSTSTLFKPPCKVAVLDREKLGGSLPGRAHIHKRPEQQPLVFGSVRNLEPRQIVPLRYEMLYEPEPALILRHILHGNHLSRTFRSSRAPCVAAQALRHPSALRFCRPRCGRYRRGRTRRRRYLPSSRQPPSCFRPRP